MGLLPPVLPIVAWPSTPFLSICLPLVRPLQGPTSVLVPTGLFTWPVLPVVPWSSTLSLSTDVLLVGPCKGQHPCWFPLARIGLFAWPILPVVVRYSTPSLSIDLPLEGPYKSHHSTQFLSTRLILPVMFHTTHHPPPFPIGLQTLLPLTLPAYINVCLLVPFTSLWSMVLQNSCILPHY